MIKNTSNHIERSDFMQSEGNTWLRKTKKPLNPDLLEHLDYYQLGIIFILNTFGPQQIKNMWDNTSEENLSKFFFYLYVLIEKGYVEEDGGEK